MNNYINNLNETIKSYYKILSKDFPEFLSEYIETPAMLKQSKISVSCGTIYSKMYNQMWYSSLDHSIAVSLIIWHFTKDKRQTLAGLFHDIATPVFKHSIDFMNNDYEKQESTEELTTKIIQESTELMYLLNRDGIKVEEVSDYHIYPIADNDTPRLSSDRLEYTLSNGLGATRKFWTLEDVKQIYGNIEIQKDESGIDELGFKDIAIAEKFVHTMSILSRLYIQEKTLFSMQMLADIMKKMLDKNLISIKEIYNLSEKDIINKIKQCNEDNIAECFKNWENATEINTSESLPKDKYFVNIEKVKKRYINPLVRLDNKYKRIKDISVKADIDINDALKYKTAKYVFLDFNFK
jgi:HD superfamily phosphohydrolase